MKKLFTLCFLLILPGLKSNAQTQFPFYGFELSNYEVGDTLEYHTNTLVSYSNCWSDDIYCIIGKQYLARNDSIEYKIRFVSNSVCESNSTYHTSFLIDTLNLGMNNYAVSGNHNNLLSLNLYSRLLGKDSLTHNDSSYILFDTIAGLKRLKYEFSSVNFGVYNYQAMQNIGIEYWSNGTEYHEGNTNGYLEFYHLAHSRTDGTLYKLYNNVDQPPAITPRAFILYERDLTVCLYITSSQPLSNAALFVYDLLGRNIKTQQVTIGNNPINMSTLPKGMYVYKIESNGNILGQGKFMNMAN